MSVLNDHLFALGVDQKRSGLINPIIKHFRPYSITSCYSNNDSIFLNYL